jgi:hypothetical protein
MRRYARHLILGEIATAGQERLLDACVAVAGCDNAAAAAVDYLIAAGIGTIALRTSGAAPAGLLPLAHTAETWGAAVRSVANRLNPDVRIIEDRAEGDWGTFLEVGAERIYVAVQGSVARVAVGECRVCTSGAASHALAETAKANDAACIDAAISLFAGAAAAAESVKLVLGLPGLNGSVLSADLALARFVTRPLPTCDECRRSR